MWDGAVIAAHPENIKSRHIAERLHFCQEGVLRDVVLQQGQYIDWVIYSLLQTEWPVTLNCAPFQPRPIVLWLVELYFPFVP